MYSGPLYQKLGQSRKCAIASKFMVQDSDTSNLDRDLGLCHIMCAIVSGAASKFPEDV